MPDPATLLINWTNLQQQDGPQQTLLGEARIPVDASPAVKRKMLESAIGQWLRFERGRGWTVVSGVTVGKPRPTFDTRTGRTLAYSHSYALTATFQPSGDKQEAA